MLSAAAQRNDRYLVAAPNLKVAAAQKIASKLIGAGLVGRSGRKRERLSGGAMTKLAQVVELLQQDRGASIDELIVLTGWLPHTTRAALTGLRKRGFATANLTGTALERSPLLWLANGDIRTRCASSSPVSQQWSSNDEWSTR